MSAPRTADDYEAEQAREWQQYRAVVPIDYYGVRAYNAGDPVAASAVDGDGAWVHRDWVDQRQPFTGSQTSPPPQPPTVDESTLAAPQGAAAVPPPAAAPAADGSTVTSTED